MSSQGVPALAPTQSEGWEYLEETFLASLITYRHISSLFPQGWEGNNYWRKQVIAHGLEPIFTTKIYNR